MGCFVCMILFDVSIKQTVALDARASHKPGRVLIVGKDSKFLIH